MVNNIFTHQRKCTLESVCMTILYVCLCACTRQDHEWCPAFCNAYLQTICPIQAGLGDGELIYFSPFNKMNTHATDMQSHLEIVALWQSTCKIIAMTIWQPNLKCLPAELVFLFNLLLICCKKRQEEYWGK